jgi:hypothetical protein
VIILQIVVFGGWFDIRRRGAPWIDPLEICKVCVENPQSKAVPLRRQASDSRKLETRKPQRLLVECQGAGTTRSRAERCDDSIGKRALSFFECNHGAENLLLVFHKEHIGLKHALDSRNYVIGGQPVGTVQRPDGLDIVTMPTKPGFSSVSRRSIVSVALGD